jgi:ABC-2 type transport system permease protein
MPMRIALGVAPVWEAGLTVALAAALIVALVGVTARIYRNSVMRTGARVPFRDALRGA